MTHSHAAPQHRGRHTVTLSTPHVHKSPLLPKSLFWCDGSTLARALTDDAQQLLRTPVLSLSMPEDVLAAAEKCGCTLVLLTRQDGSRLYARLDAFRGPQSFQVERGSYGRQRALPLSAMSKTPEGAQPEAMQPALFFEELTQAGIARRVGADIPADVDPFAGLP